MAAFSSEEISGDMLLEAKDEMLEELGVTSAVERLKIKVQGLVQPRTEFLIIYDHMKP